MRKQPSRFAISAQLNSRLSDPEEASEADESHQTGSVLPVVPAGTAGATETEGAKIKGEKTETKRKKKGRKDLYGIGNAIDTFATNALTRSRGAFVLERTKNMLEDVGVSVKCAEIMDDPTKQHRVQSIIAGSVRAHDRLYEAGLIEEKNRS